MALGKTGPELERSARAQVFAHCTVPNTAALTFDDGPYIYLYDVVNELKAANATGTFFFNGNNFHDEMLEVNLALQRIIGVIPAFVRPPYGRYNNLVLNEASAFGQSIALWDFEYAKP
ncbi:hypothetical protein H0H92_007158 [Tricholoma furcatifolium]|nr:hypothetical protein H0H92_007158 [Tricholoma furcatifolium]